MLTYYSLREDMHKLCEDRKGGPVLYELIEVSLWDEIKNDVNICDKISCDALVRQNFSVTIYWVCWPCVSNHWFRFLMKSVAGHL